MHVAVLGAGYAGLTLTKLLESDLPEDVDLTLVNESPDHLVQHELHRVIRWPSLADDITISLAETLERATVRIARVERIDRDERTVLLSDGHLEYDLCAICLGAETAFYDLEGVTEHATPLKRLHHARQIRSQVLEALEGENPQLVVGGAGLSGVQVAGELAAMLAEANGDSTDETVIEITDSGDHSEAFVPPATTGGSVTLLEQAAAVAPNFPPAFQDATAATLERAGVDVWTDTTVVSADTDQLTVSTPTADTRTVPYDVFVWTGGISGPESLDGERPVVRHDLRLDDRTFVLGDAARVVDTDGEAVPASAQSAVRQARVGATNIKRLVAYERDGGLFEPRLERFAFDSPGWLISVGDDAVAQVGPSVFTGSAAKALKTTVGVGYFSSIGAHREAVELVQAELECQTESSRQ